MPIKGLISACNFYSEKVDISKMFVNYIVLYHIYIFWKPQSKIKFLNFLKIIEKFGDYV